MIIRYPPLPHAELTLKHIFTPSPKLLPAMTSREVSDATLPGSPRSLHHVRHLPLISKQCVEPHVVAFGSFGAIRTEPALHEVDLQRDKQRRGDSDVG